MESEFVFGEWKGRLDAGLPRGQVEAIVLAFNDYTEKMTARYFGLSPVSVQKRLERAKFKLSEKGKPPIRSTRALCLEAMKRGIIAPLMVALLVGGEHSQIRPIRRPEAPRSQVMVRAKRVEEAGMLA